MTRGEASDEPYPHRPGGGPAPAMPASAGMMTRHGQPGEEQGGGQAVGGELVGAAVRDAFDDLVGAESAQA